MFRKAHEELYMTQYEEMQLRKIAPLQDGIDPKQGERVNRVFPDKNNIRYLDNSLFIMI